MIQKVNKSKVAVFTCGLDVAQTETKGTVLIKKADELLNFTTGEEKHLEKVSFSSFKRYARRLTIKPRFSKKSPTLG